MKNKMTATEFRAMVAKKDKTRGRKPSGANQATKNILSFLNNNGFFAWRNNTTGIWDPKKQLFRKHHGLKGVSDILGLQCSTGRFIAVEVKAGKDKLRTEQDRFLKLIEKRNGLACVASCAGDVVNYLEDKGVI